MSPHSYHRQRGTPASSTGAGRSSSVGSCGISSGAAVGSTSGASSAAGTESTSRIAWSWAPAQRKSQRKSIFLSRIPQVLRSSRVPGAVGRMSEPCNHCGSEGRQKDSPGRRTTSAYGGWESLQHSAMMGHGEYYREKQSGVPGYGYLPAGEVSQRTGRRAGMLGRETGDWDSICSITDVWGFKYGSAEAPGARTAYRPTPPQSRPPLFLNQFISSRSLTAKVRAPFGPPDKSPSNACLLVTISHELNEFEGFPSRSTVSRRT
ncbi:hypothetical protein B0H17DRAFT_1270604 [Mycena rosella]|uniref:Uncharacterized protein n=1 Tax=Mycena rosella TaxID=1033263 RepID=A0AAD7DPG7_MYCRO|nr:hypothetical protein B0H17DRAFT_1270604 [Mycena rosella]